MSIQPFFRVFFICLHPTFLRCFLYLFAVFPKTDESPHAAVYSTIDLESLKVNPCSNHRSDALTFASSHRHSAALSSLPSPASFSNALYSCSRTPSLSLTSPNPFLHSNTNKVHRTYLNIRIDVVYLRLFIRNRRFAAAQPDSSPIRMVYGDTNSSASFTFITIQPCVVNE